MITFNLEYFNNFNQNTYNEAIDNLQIHQLPCPCGCGCHCVFYGTYTRSLKTRKGTIPLLIQRVICKTCKHTHALLPSFIVPYSQVLLSYPIRIIKANSISVIQEIMEEMVEIDENTIYYIKQQYRHHWKERLHAFEIEMDVSLIYQCFHHYKRQFMQIKRTLHILFTTINIT